MAHNKIILKKNDITVFLTEDLQKNGITQKNITCFEQIGITAASEVFFNYFQNFKTDNVIDFTESFFKLKSYASKSDYLIFYLHIFTKMCNSKFKSAESAKFLRMVLDNIPSTDLAERTQEIFKENFINLLIYNGVLPDLKKSKFKKFEINKLQQVILPILPSVLNEENKKILDKIQTWLCKYYFDSNAVPEQSLTGNSKKLNKLNKLNESMKNQIDELRLNREALCKLCEEQSTKIADLQNQIKIFETKNSQLTNEIQKSNQVLNIFNKNSDAMLKETLNKISSKLEFLYYELQSIQDLEMTVKLGESLRSRMQTVFKILEQNGICVFDKPIVKPSEIKSSKKGK